MARIARKNLNTSFIHIMVQGVNKEYIFSKEKYKKNYLNLIRKNIKNFNLTILAYCIMSNHAHFLIYVKEINELGKFMHKINHLYSNLYNREEKRCGVLFRNRYRAEPIYDEKYLINCIKYIHDNPVKAQMVTRCDEYQYSSYNDYMLNTGCANNEVMKSIFGEKYDYLNLFEKLYEKRFMDIKEDYGSNLNMYISDSISQYENKNSKNIYELISNKNNLKELIMYLKKVEGFTYVDIQKYFEISYNDMLKLKRIRKK